MWRTVGHDLALNVLRRSLVEGRMSHAYLLAGSSGVGKMTLARDIARAANCLGDERPCGECEQCSRIEGGLHADVQVVALESQRAGIGIEQVRRVQQDAALTPYEGRSRVFIVDGAEHLTAEAANSLLKTLEEPPDRVVLILLTSNVEALPETVVSRCQRLELRPIAVELVSQELQSRYGADDASADEAAKLSRGLMGWAVGAVTDPQFLERLDERLQAVEDTLGSGLEDRFAYAMDLASTFARAREQGRDELALWLEWWRDVLLAREGLPELAVYLSRAGGIEEVAGRLTTVQVVRAISAIRATMGYLDRNANARLALENLMLALPAA